MAGKRAGKISINIATQDWTYLINVFLPSPFYGLFQHSNKIFQCNNSWIPIRLWPPVFGVSHFPINKTQEWSTSHLTWMPYADVSKLHLSAGPGISWLLHIIKVFEWRYGEVLRHPACWETSHRPADLRPPAYTFTAIFIHVQNPCKRHVSLCFFQSFWTWRKVAVKVYAGGLKYCILGTILGKNTY